MARSLTMILGPMFSGKTTELLRLVRRAAIAEKNVLIVKYMMDTRYSEDSYVLTHDGGSLRDAKGEERIKHVPAGKVSDILEFVPAFDVIAIDEGQFFSDLRSGCEYLMGVGKDIIISALDGSYKQEIFQPIAETLPIATDYQKVTAICRYCYADAPFTKRLIESSELEIIGGSEIYAPVCRSCLR